MMQQGREMKMFYCHVDDEDNQLHNKVLATGDFFPPERLKN